MFPAPCVRYIYILTSDWSVLESVTLLVQALGSLSACWEFAPSAPHSSCVCIYALAIFLSEALIQCSWHLSQ